MRRLWIGSVACALAFALARGSEGEVEELLDQLGANAIQEREKAQEELAKRLSLMKGGELGGLLRRVARVAEGHRDREVRDRAGELLVPYSGGSILWALSGKGTLRLNGDPRMLVIGGSIAVWGENPHGNSFLRVVDAASGRVLWEKRPIELLGAIVETKEIPEGLWVGGICGQERAWTAVYDLKTGKVLRQRTLRGVPGDKIRFHDAEPGLLIDSGSDHEIGRWIALFAPDSNEPKWRVRLHGYPSQIEILKNAFAISAIDMHWNAAGAAIQTSCLLALDPGTGRELWRRELWRNEGGKGEWCRISACEAGVFAVVGRRAGSGRMELSLIEPATGRALWNADAEGEGQLAVLEPAPGGMLLVLANRGRKESAYVVRLIDIRSGTTVWNAADRIPVGAIQCVFRIPGHGVFLAGADSSGQAWMVLLDDRSGRPRWERRPGTLPGLIIGCENEGGEIWVRGETAKTGDAWFGVYSVVDAKPRSEMVLDKTDGIQTVQAGKSCAVAVSYDPKGAMRTVLHGFDLDSGRRRWSREVVGQGLPGHLLPSGFLLFTIEEGDVLDPQKVLSLYRIDALWEE